MDLAIPASGEDEFLVVTKLQYGYGGSMFLENMQYLSFFVPYGLQIDTSALHSLKSQIDIHTSRPDSSHSASEWTARQYTADISGAFIECFIGVEK